MSEGAEPHSEQRGPSEFRDPLIRQEMKKAAVWLGMTVFLLAAFFLSQPLLLILAGIVFASILDGGTRLLGRVLPIGRGWRLAIVTLAGVAFIAWTFYFAGVTLVAQAEGLRQMLTDQVNRILGWATRMGLVDLAEPDQLVQRLARGPRRHLAARPGGAEAVSEGAGPHSEQRGPSELRDPLIRQEMKKAAVWLGMAVFLMAIFVLAQPLLLILAGIVFASVLDGGTRLLGRVLPIGRGWRLAIVTLAGIAFIVWTFYFAGVTFVDQAEGLRQLLTGQVNRMLAWANRMGLVEGGAQLGQIGGQLSSQLMGTLGRLTSAVGSALGALASIIMILVIGIFVAVEPRLYERGVAWMLPMRSRDNFYQTSSRMGFTLRRLMAGRLTGMAVEGVGTWLLLVIGGVPMAALLGLLTGILAFIPNIGAIISGVLIVLAGFSVSPEHGIWAIAVYLIVQTVDGYLIVPYVARRTVDLAPALVLGAQLLFGALFGLMGLMLADPIIAMIKVALEEKSKQDGGGRAAKT